MSLQNFNHTQNVVLARPQETTLVSQGIRRRKYCWEGLLPIDWLLWRICRISKKGFAHLESILFAYNRRILFAHLEREPVIETGCPVLAYTELFPPDTIEFLSLRASSASREYTLKVAINTILRARQLMIFYSPCLLCLPPPGSGSWPRDWYWPG